MKIQVDDDISINENFSICLFLFPFVFVFVIIFLSFLILISIILCVPISVPSIWMNTCIVSVDTDYFENFNLNGADITLNSAKFEVHAAKNIILTLHASTTPFPVDQAVGNPYSTWRKWQWNIKYDFNVRSTEDARWRSIKFDQMQNDQKFYLFTYSVSLG